MKHSLVLIICSCFCCAPRWAPIFFKTSHEWNFIIPHMVRKWEIVSTCVSRTDLLLSAASQYVDLVLFFECKWVLVGTWNFFFFLVFYRRSILLVFVLYNFFFSFFAFFFLHFFVDLFGCTLTLNSGWMDNLHALLFFFLSATGSCYTYRK